MGEHSCGIRNTNGSVLAGFLETHGLFACNTAFQPATRHKNTLQGQYNDATNWNSVAIHNTIDFVICHHSYKSLLTDYRAYAGTLLDSDHHLLIAQLDLSRLYYVWSGIAQPPSVKHAATTPNSWPVNLSLRSSAMQCQSRYQRSIQICPQARSGIY